MLGVSSKVPSPWVNALLLSTVGDETRTKCKSHLILIAGQQRKPLLTAASLAPEAKTFCNGSVLTGVVSENICLTKFEWLGNSFSSIGKYKQRYPREKKGYKSHASVQLYVGSISLMHHIVFQGICWRIFSTRLNLQMACKAPGHTKHDNNKARHWIAAHYVSTIQLKHWQNRGRNSLWWGHLSVLSCILAALHKLSLGS